MCPMLGSSSSIKMFMYIGEEGNMDHRDGAQSGRMADVVAITSDRLWNKPQLGLF